jgi:hypothetical protein
LKPVKMAMAASAARDGPAKNRGSRAQGRAGFSPDRGSGSVAPSRCADRYRDDPRLTARSAKSMHDDPPKNYGGVPDNSFQHFTELDEKAVFLRGLGCGRTVSLLRSGNLQRAVFLLA